MYLYFDIETIPDQREGIYEHIAERVKPPAQMTKPETVEKWEAEKKEQAVEDAYRKAGLSGAYGQIIVIGYAIEDDDVQIVASDSERHLIREFFAQVEEARTFGKGRIEPLQWVGHNVLGFDLRFLYKRAAVNDVSPPFNLPAYERPWSNEVVDTMLEWSCYDRQDRISLTDLLFVLGIEDGGGDIDGSEVYDYWLDGDIEAVIEHCRQDVDRVRKAHERLSFITHREKM